MQGNKEQAEKWANEFLESEEGKGLSKKLELEFRDYVVFGIEPKYIDKKFAKELKDYTESKGNER